MSTPRMQWVSQRIVETFEPSVTQAEVTEFLASPGTRKLFNELLSGKDACKVFVHFQGGASAAAAAENGATPAVATAPMERSSSSFC